MIELIDRFGKTPIEVDNLFKLIDLRILCFQKNIEEIKFGKKGILFSFYLNKPHNIEKVLNLTNDYKKNKIKLRPDNKIFYNFEGILNDDIFKIVNQILNKI